MYGLPAVPAQFGAGRTGRQLHKIRPSRLQCLAARALRALRRAVLKNPHGANCDLTEGPFYRLSAPPRFYAAWVISRLTDSEILAILYPQRPNNGH
jgi:hypothetical protein